MSEARRQVLTMLQEGKITADQAANLLQALGDDEAAPLPAVFSEPESPPLEGDVMRSAPPPDMDRYRRFWQIPFFITLTVMLLLGMWLRSLYQSSAGAITFGFVCVWSLFMFTFLLVALSFMSRSATWLHVRVREKNGRRVAISLPLPLRLATWGLSFARRFVPESEQDKLDMAAEFVNAARDNLKQAAAEPIMINVDDEDGDQVLVYIG